MEGNLDTRTITKYLDLTTALPNHADLAMVFGTRLHEPVEVAARLMADGIAGHVLLTGGANRQTGISEAQGHLTLLLERGIARDRILVEARSTNTLENVLFALPFLEQHCALAELEAVIAVAKWYHSRRALMTLKRHFPSGITFYAATYEPKGIARHDWHRSVEGRRAVLKEVDGISRYLQAGDIAEVNGDSSGYR